MAFSIRNKSHPVNEIPGEVLFFIYFLLPSINGYAEEKIYQKFIRTLFLNIAENQLIVHTDTYFLQKNYM